MEDMKLASITLRTNGTIADAINTYTTMGVPLSQLLTDYNDVITYPDLLETAVNPWESMSVLRDADFSFCIWSVSACIIFTESMKVFL